MHCQLTVVQEELSNGQQCPGISKVPTDSAMQDLQAGERPVHIVGVLPADNIHDSDSLNETLHKKVQQDQNCANNSTTTTLPPASFVLTAFCRSPSGFFRAPNR